jgi:hypothetical protein
MLSVPKFWERLVILVDSPATPLSAIVSFLSWSRNKPLNVTITRRWGTEDPMNGQPELWRIITIMNILGPHLHRIHGLCFDVTFTSSLPSFPYCFRGSAPILERLELLCRKDDGGRDSGIPIHLSITEPEEFECPKLVCLTIDGRNHYKVSVMDPEWTDTFSDIEVVTISHLKLRRGESISTHQFLLPLLDTRVNTLNITDVQLNLSPEGLPNDFQGMLQFLVFEDMHNSLIMDQINQLIDPCEVSFIRCTFNHVAHPFRRFGSPEFGGWLILEELDQDIAPLIRLFDGYHLNITRCPSFNDSILGMMTGPAGNLALLWTRYLRSIVLTDCPNFSIAALQRFVESRMHLPFDDGGGGIEEAQIDYLHLFGNVPSMSEAERAWFEEHVEQVKYVPASR